MPWRHHCSAVRLAKSSTLTTPSVSWTARKEADLSKELLTAELCNSRRIGYNLRVKEVTDEINSYNGTLFSYYRKNEGDLYALIWEDNQNLSLTEKKERKKKQVNILCNILCNKGENGG